jgi:signal transduction histidine kinase
LLNNAVEHSSAQLIQIKLGLTEDQKLKISVSDNGCGIDSKNLALIKNGHTTKESGNGIGLSSGIRTLKAWAGDLSINSSKGSGTEVTLTLNSIDKAIIF